VDADLLLAHVLRVSRGRLLTLDAVGEDDAERFSALVEQRADRVPLQHLTGRAPFRQLELAVGPGVFVPRPETEQLTGWALDRIAELDGPLVVDLGSGSGAIALSIAHEHPGARVTAVERDPGALHWTRHNASLRVGAGDTPVGVVQGDMTDPALLQELDGRVSVVVSNPPYVPDEAIPRDPEVRNWDPPAALYGGADGLDVVRVLSRTALRLLHPGGSLIIEHGEWQGEPIRALLAADGWRATSTHRDLTLRDRLTTAIRP